MNPVKVKNPGPLDDDNMMLERLLRERLEIEEILQWYSDPFPKEKIAQYTNSPPALPTPPQNDDDLWADLRSSHISLMEQKFVDDKRAMSLGIPQGMMRKELDIIKLTGQFVVRYGIYFQKALQRDTRFKFLDASDTRCSLVGGLVQGYTHLIRHCVYRRSGMETTALQVFFAALKENRLIKRKKEKHEEDEVLDKVETDRRDFVVVCDEYFAEIENTELLMIPAFRVRIPQGGMMRKELGIFKFTAQFVVRYGKDFWDALWDRVSAETEFQFLKRTPGNDTFFSQLVLAYGKVIQLSGMPQIKWSNPALMEVALQGFFSAFHAFKGKQEDERDELVDKVVTDRRYFVVSAEYFQYFLDIEARFQILLENRVPNLMTHPPTTSQV